MSAKLTELGAAHVQIHGSQKDGDRQAAIDAFQDNGVHVILVNSQAGGASVSLHDVKHERPRTSLLVPSWNAADVKQCLGRIRRCGGTAVVQKIVLAAGTIQERVAASLQRKLKNIDSLNDADLAP